MVISRKIPKDFLIIRVLAPWDDSRNRVGCQIHVRIQVPNTADPALFRVGRVDSNDIGRKVTKALSISSHEFSSHEQGGTVKFAVSGSGKKGRRLVLFL